MALRWARAMVRVHRVAKAAKALAARVKNAKALAVRAKPACRSRHKTPGKSNWVRYRETGGSPRGRRKPGIVKLGGFQRRVQRLEDELRLVKKQRDEEDQWSAMLSDNFGAAMEQLDRLYEGVQTRDEELAGLHAAIQSRDALLQKKTEKINTMEARAMLKNTRMAEMAIEKQRLVNQNIELRRELEKARELLLPQRPRPRSPPRLQRPFPAPTTPRSRRSPIPAAIAAPLGQQDFCFVSFCFDVCLAFACASAGTEQISSRGTGLSMQETLRTPFPVTHACVHARGWVCLFLRVYV